MSPHLPSIFSEWELPSANLSVPEIRMPQMPVEESAPEMQDGGYDAALQTLGDSLAELLSLVRMIAGKDTANTITNRADITQNFYAPTVDSYSVKNAASLAVSAAQVKACRM